jgi:hypothetical protein
MHGKGSLFARTASKFTAHSRRCAVTGVSMQPANERSFSTQRASFARQISEYQLDHVGSQSGIACDFAKRDGINQIDMPSDQFRKHGFGTGFNPRAEQIAAIGHRL